MADYSQQRTDDGSLAPPPPRAGFPPRGGKEWNEWSWRQRLVAAAGHHRELLQAVAAKVSLFQAHTLYDALGRGWQVLARPMGQGQVPSLIPWRVERQGDYVTIAPGSRIWAESVDQTPYISNYHIEKGNVRGYAHQVVPDRWVCFELNLDSDADISLLSIYLRDARKGFYEATEERLMTQYLPIAYIDGSGQVASQFVTKDPILVRANVNGYAGWMIL